MDDTTYFQIDALMAEAGAAGDSDMYRICRRALEDEDAESVSECLRVIAEAAAQ